MLSNKYILGSLLVFSFIILSGPGYTAQQTEQQYAEEDWGIGVAVRTATIPFDTHDESVSSFVPLMFFEGERVFFDGLEGGIKILDQQKYRLDLLGRLRFFDIPREYQNEIQGDTIDFGLRLSYLPTANMESSLDILTDDGGRLHTNLLFGYHQTFSRLELEPFANLRFGSKEFNSYYYGLDIANVDSDVEFSLGISGRYHIWKNLYAIGQLKSTWFGSDVRQSPYVDRDSTQEMSLGIGLFNEDRAHRKPSLKIRPYLRLAHGWATPSNIGEILSGNTVADEYNNQLTSLFYGHPLTDELFNLPISVYLTPGFIYHWSSEVQSAIPEYVVAIKAYYTFTWPITWRFGAAEGLSYVTDIPYVEQTEMDRKGYEPSNLMNYLDFSIDIDLGSLFNSKTLNNWYLGYSIHHRSAIFESASQFGRISGGSNFNTVYLQHHF